MGSVGTDTADPADRDKDRFQFIHPSGSARFGELGLSVLSFRGTASRLFLPIRRGHAPRRPVSRIGPGHGRRRNLFRRRGLQRPAVFGRIRAVPRGWLDGGRCLERRAERIRTGGFDLRRHGF